MRGLVGPACRHTIGIWERGSLALLDVAAGLVVKAGLASLIGAGIPSQLPLCFEYTCFVRVDLWEQAYGHMLHWNGNSCSSSKELSEESEELSTA